ncbi:circadian clock KaiB family protein [Gloeocapsa sp. PCC 73106]|uniref:circadian clock KaiB family protein n=1 Tax=Gloeocapsa sp. PCC 73106 TaxID=102232 RepID=UPI0002AC6A34|nr:circadian clock KaiB family protein [Gloeocapsa sp. PCC 73106]ELR99803.1 KaiB domain-containing protein [Gloeocapsa sp. PCC 73106]
MLETSFKGIALFTPGGDLFYCIDPTKQSRWHLHLCIAIQETLDLSEPPHFLVPAYTATVDRWITPSKGKNNIAATLYPRVKSYQPLLNTIFNLAENFNWEVALWQEEFCDPIVLEAYQHQFPQLWENHELIIKVESFKQSKKADTYLESTFFTPEGYTLILFVSNHSSQNSETLQSIHRILEEGLNLPYTLKVIDITKHPEQAEKFQISATPTLLRTQPQPIRRIVGEFANWQRVLQILTS